MRKRHDNKKPFNQKVIGSGAKDNPDTQPPLFSFEKMASNTGYSVDCCDAENQAAVSKRLFKLSQLKWRDIRQAPRHGLGTETIARSSLTAPLPPSVTEDTTILALRYNGKRPMIGYREGRVFYVLLIDHDFSAYDHG